MTEVGEGVAVPGPPAEGSEWDLEDGENWVELEYLDANDKPVAGAKYVVLDGDGSELASGTLDGNGFAHVDLPPDVFEVEYYFHDDPDEYQISEEFKPIDNPRAEAEDDPGFWERTKQALSDAAEWTWGVIQGDFNDDPSISQIIVRTIITLIPVVDQVGDVQDIVANLKKLIIDRKYDDWEVWFALVVTLIGCIPEIGTVIKAIAKLLKREAKALEILKLFRILNWMGAGNAFRFLKKLRGELGKHAADVAKKLDEMLSAIDGRLNDLRKWVSSSVQRQIDELCATIGELRAMAPAKINEVFEYLGKKIDEVLDSAKRMIKRGETRRKHTTRQQKEMPPVKGQQTKSLDDLLNDSTPGRPTKGKTTQFEKPGDFNQANQDFDSLSPTDVKHLEGGGRMGTLSDGRTVIVRPNSTSGAPTLEVQAGKKRTKIRYGG